MKKVIHFKEREFNSEISSIEETTTKLKTIAKDFADLGAGDMTPEAWGFIVSKNWTALSKLVSDDAKATLKSKGINQASLNESVEAGTQARINQLAKKWDWPISGAQPYIQHLTIVNGDVSFPADARERVKEKFETSITTEWGNTLHDLHVKAAESATAFLKTIDTPMYQAWQVFTGLFDVTETGITPKPLAYDTFGKTIK